MLEDKIDALIMALEENTAALRSAGGIAKTVASAKPAPVAAPAKPVAKPASKPLPPADEDEEDDTDEDDAIPYADIKAKIIAIGKDPSKGRPVVEAVLAKFGVSHGTELETSQYAAALAALTKAAKGK